MLQKECVLILLEQLNLTLTAQVLWYQTLLVISTVSSGGGAGGPYLPLAGGAMTGAIKRN